MIELSSEWLTEAARQAADEEDAWCAARPSWLALDDELSAVVEPSVNTAAADHRWAKRFKGLAKHRSPSDMRRWREASARQTAPVFPFFAAAPPNRAA